MTAIQNLVLTLGFAKSRRAAQQPAMAEWPKMARRPMAQSRPSTVPCKAAIPHTSTDLHCVWVCNMDDHEFQSVYHLVIWIVWQCTSFVSGSVHRWINREWQHFSLNHKQWHKGLKRIQMIIKIVAEFKLTAIKFCTPKPVADLCMRVDSLLDKKTVENQDWATAPLGHCGLWPAGRQAFRLLGLLSAKPAHFLSHNALCPTKETETPDACTLN